MLAVDDALTICRAFAAQSGEERDNDVSGIVVKTRVYYQLAAAVERLLVELQLARDEAGHYRAQLIQWGIPAKRRTIKRLESGGFERGWE